MDFIPFQYPLIYASLSPMNVKLNVKDHPLWTKDCMSYLRFFRSVLHFTQKVVKVMKEINSANREMSLHT